MPWDGTPCPKCGKRSHIMAGVLVPGCDKRETYLVCWKDKLCRPLHTEKNWKPFAARKSGQIEWRKHTSTHWQTDIDGELVDYWPSKRKIQFRGKILRGGEFEVQQLGKLL
jgi:hypothetical protein